LPVASFLSAGIERIVRHHTLFQLTSAAWLTDGGTDVRCLGGDLPILAAEAATTLCGRKRRNDEIPGDGPKDIQVELP
jgi:hypothetical protein